LLVVHNALIFLARARPAARDVCCGANVTIGPEVHPGRETMLTTP